MKLGTINRILRWFGVVLVVEIDDAGESPTRMLLMTWRRYQAHAKRPHLLP